MSENTKLNSSEISNALLFMDVSEADELLSCSITESVPTSPGTAPENEAQGGMEIAQDEPAQEAESADDDPPIAFQTSTPRAQYSRAKIAKNFKTTPKSAKNKRKVLKGGRVGGKKNKQTLAAKKPKKCLATRSNILELDPIHLDESQDANILAVENGVDIMHFELAVSAPDDQQEDGTSVLTCAELDDSISGGELDPDIGSLSNADSVSANNDSTDTAISREEFLETSGQTTSSQTSITAKRHGKPDVTFYFCPDMLAVAKKKIVDRHSKHLTQLIDANVNVETFTPQITISNAPLKAAMGYALGLEFGREKLKTHSFFGNVCRGGQNERFSKPALTESEQLKVAALHNYFWKYMSKKKMDQFYREETNAGIFNRQSSNRCSSDKKANENRRQKLEMGNEPPKTAGERARIARIAEEKRNMRKLRMSKPVNVAKRLGIIPHIMGSRTHLGALNNN